jgi:hypothetical protein
VRPMAAPLPLPALLCRLGTESRRV